MIRCWKHTIVGLLSLFLIGFLACQKTATEKKVELTPLQTLINTDTTLSLYHLMLLRANDIGLMKDTTASLLVPRNEVLVAAGYPEIIIDSMSSALADRIVRYNYLPSGISTDSGGATPTRLGAPLYIQDNGNGTLVLNGTGMAGDKPASVGQAAVYWLTSMVPPAADSLPDILSTDSSLTYLNAVFARTNIYDSLLQTGSFTLLAPVNIAFQAAGYDSIGAIDSANVDTLIQLALNQVVKGSYFTTTFPSTVTNMTGAGILVTRSNGILQFAGGGNVTPVHWLSGDNVAGQSTILHKTDGIVSP
jgi:hypothetical protein